MRSPRAFDSNPSADRARVWALGFSAGPLVSLERGGFLGSLGSSWGAVVGGAENALVKDSPAKGVEGVPGSAPVLE